MKFTVQLPISVIEPAGEFQTMAAVREISRAIEDAGLDAAFITDHPAPDTGWLHRFGHDALDPFTGLAFVAAATERLRLHTNIVVLAYRNPFITAKAAATLQVLSGGRLILGVGVGYQTAEFEALGVDFQNRGPLADEALEVMQKAWAGGPVVWRGSNFNAAGNEPRPAPEPPPAIWVGGSSEKALRRAARFGDGWSPFYAVATTSSNNKDTAIRSIEHLRECAERLQGYRAELGKTGPFDIVMGPKMRIKARTPESAERYLGMLDELERAGVNWATVDLAHPSRAEFIENVQWFREEVAARVKPKAAALA